jgi:ribosome maturation factor RimP
LAEASAAQSTLESIVEPVCRAHGVELVDVRHFRRKGGAVVRVIIDRERIGVEGEEPGSGVTVDDCTNVSRDISAALDVHEDLIQGAYNLEVSSPGLERPLIRLQDFERFAGREARIQSNVRIGERRRFKGRLLGVVDREVEIEQDGTPVRIPYDNVAKANLVYRFDSAKRK